MTRQLLEVRVEANEKLAPHLVKTREYALELTARIGLTAGAAVTFGGLTVVLSGEPHLAARVMATISAGVAVGTATTGLLTYQSWRFIRGAAMTTTEIYSEDNEDEAEAWQEPPQPDDMPSFVRHANEPKNLRRVNHNMKRSDLLLLSQLAKVGRKLPTRESLVARGFTNNAQAFTNLRRELQKTGVVDSQYCWTREGWEWIYSEANRPTRN
jgi:hypothetical protein